MRLSYGARSKAGFDWEDKIATRLRRKGHDVMVMGRNNRYDLMVNDSLRVDVKAVSYTEYKGSDGYHIRGWVVTNLSVPPTADFYVVVCLDASRTQEVKTYVIPASALNQKTLTITQKKAITLIPFLNAYSQFDQMKHANLQPLGHDKIEEKSTTRRTVGGLIGGLVGLGVAQVVSGRIYNEDFSIKFGDVLGMSIGSAIGSRL